MLQQLKSLHKQGKQAMVLPVWQVHCYSSPLRHPGQVHTDISTLAIILCIPCLIIADYYIEEKKKP